MFKPKTIGKALLATGALAVAVILNVTPVIANSEVGKEALTFISTPSASPEVVAIVEEFAQQQVESFKATGTWADYTTPRLDGVKTCIRTTPATNWLVTNASGTYRGVTINVFEGREPVVTVADTSDNARLLWDNCVEEQPQRGIEIHSPVATEVQETGTAWLTIIRHGLGWVSEEERQQEAEAGV